MKPLAVLAQVAIAGALAGCGSSSSSSSSAVSAGSYIKSVCTAVTPWENEVQKRGAAFNLPDTTTVPRVKQALETFLSGVAADSQQVVSQLMAAGQPSVTNGKTISAAILGAFSGLHRAALQALAQAKALPTDSQQSFTAAAQRIGPTIRTALKSITASMQSGMVRSPQLVQAAAKVPACNSLRSQLSG